MRRRTTKWSIAALVLGLLGGSSSGGAQEPETPAAEVKAEEPSPKATFRERVTVVGTAETLSEIPGSAHLLGGADLERRKRGFDDIHRLLRPIPGLIIQEEDGFGRRPNIGMRGTGTDRSSRIALMEDGVLIAPAPYSAPAAYYFPVSGRMESVEVRKGSSQIKYGPNTGGGALNLVSTSIPDAFRLSLRAEGGQHGSGKAHLFVGDSSDHVDWLIETYQGRSRGFKNLDGGGDTGFALQDYVGKLRFHTSQDARVYQHLEIKLGATEEDSDETYLGLAENDFRRDPLRRYAASQLDVFEASHRQYQARHFVVFSRRLDVTTTAWRNDFARRWYKLESVLGAGLSGVLERPRSFAAHHAILAGADSPANALEIRNNNRAYYAQGLQTVLGLQAGLGPTRHKVEAGVRFLQDEEDRFQQDDGYQMLGGRMRLTRAGAPGSQTNQVVSASAWAFFAQDRVEWGRLSLVPGLRLERIDLRRTDYARTDPDRTSPTAVLDDDLGVLVPGIGAGVRIGPRLDLVAGLHKGFSPPGPGANPETRAEESLNYELGFRGRAGAFRAEATAFFNDYENMLGRDTLASGGSGSGDLFNAGEVRVSGLESVIQYDLRGALRLPVSVPVQASYTFTSGEFRNGFQSQYGPWGTVTAGDELPYLPRHQLFARVGVEAQRWMADLSAHHVGRMRTRAGQQALVDAQSTDATFVLDLTAEYAFPGKRLGGHLRVFGSVQNLADRAYVVARHPAGARPGLPRTITAGVKLLVGR
ncbi:MAG TPA: TonB-dependent receptor [Vicinamibacteria bacterium]|nr:TonB-dependent receptor [Vicinamibacteria bacterium]